MARERQFLGGESGAGKTYAWLSIARANPDVQFYVAEPDDGVNKLLEREYPDVLAKGNVHGAVKNPDGTWEPPAFIGSWPDFRKFVEALRSLNSEGHLSPNDWIVLEGMDIITQVIRYEYIDRTNRIDSKTKQQIEDPWEAIIVKRARGAPVLEPSDHDAINYEYERQMAFVAYTAPCNFVGTAGITRVNFESKFSDKGQKEFYASLGTPFKYEGHKRNPRLFDTLVYLYCTDVGYSMQVLKDRGIGRQDTEAVSDYYLQLERSRAKVIAAKKGNSNG